MKVLRKFRFNTITDADALTIRLYNNAGSIVKVSDTDYPGLYFDKSVDYGLVDLDLIIGQSLPTVEIREKGFKGINDRHRFPFCYVLENEDKIDEWIISSKYKQIGLKEDKNMEVMNGNFMQQMIGMKMLKNVFDSDAKDINIGKLMMMQQVLGGSAIQVTDVIKAKIMEQFALDDKNVDDLPLEKLLLLQMLDKGSIDIQQLIQFKMMNKILEEDL